MSDKPDPGIGLPPPNPHTFDPPPVPPPAGLQNIDDPQVDGVSGAEHGLQHAPSAEHGAGTPATHSAPGTESGGVQQPTSHGWDAPRDATRHTPDQQSGAGQVDSSHQIQSQQPQHGQSPSAQHQHPGEVGNQATQNSGHGMESAGQGGRGADSLQRGGDSAQHVTDAAGESANTAQHVASGHRASSRALKWRNARPRYKFAVIGGSTAAAVATAGAITLATQDDEPAAQRRPAVTTTVASPVPISDPVVVTVEPADTAVNSVAPVVTDAATTTEAPTTTLAPTTTVEPTTTLPALPSYAGSYSVASSDIVVSGGGVTFSVPSPASAPWTVTGACDGVGDCMIDAGEGSVASTGAATGFVGPGGVLPMVPGGPGIYAVQFEYPVPECGTGFGDMAINFVAGGFTGIYSFTFSGGSCPVATVTATYTGTLTG